MKCLKTRSHISYHEVLNCSVYQIPVEYSIFVKCLELERCHYNPIVYEDRTAEERKQERSSLLFTRGSGCRRCLCAVTLPSVSRKDFQSFQRWTVCGVRMQCSTTLKHQAFFYFFSTVWIFE